MRWPELGAILCIGAHSDDIEIGAGATVLRLIRANPSAHVVWVVLAAAGARGAEARDSAENVLQGAGGSTLVLGEFEDSYFPRDWAKLKGFFDGLKAHAPDLILTHYGQDLHQDHRLVSELTWNAFRNHLILEYEIPKYDGGLGSPNVFAPASIADADHKIALLMRCFPSQAHKHWFEDLTFRGLMRLRGLECCAPEGLAEAFYARKLRFD